MEEDIVKNLKIKKIVSIILTIVSISLMIGSFSYAWLNGIFTSSQTVNISAGSLNLVFNQSSNLISLTNELPKLDSTAITNNAAHTFTLTNNGTENVGYEIRLQNICNVSGTIDVCVPNTYMKAAIKTGNGAYVATSLNSTEVIARGNITASASIIFSLKLWLDELTPNIYNPGTTDNRIAYQGKIVLNATQRLGTLVSSISVSLSNSTVNVGSQIAATAISSPANARDTSYTWSSSNPLIATVSPDGTVRGILEGTTYICATANDGGNAYDCEEIIVRTP